MGSAAVVICLEIRWPGLLVERGPAPSRYSQPRAGRSATECKHGRGLSALAGTSNAEYLHLSEGGRHCRIVHRSARSERSSALPVPAELCGTRRGGQCHRGLGCGSSPSAARSAGARPPPVEHLRPGAGAAGRDSGAGTSAVPPSARTVITCLPARGSFRLPGPLDEARFTPATSCVTSRPEQSRKATCRLAGHLARAAASVPKPCAAPGALRCGPP